MSPVAVWVTFNRDELVRLVFERGEFTQAMSTLVALALFGAAPTIVFHGLVQLLSNSFYALQRISIPLFVLPAGTVLFFLAAKLLSSTYGIFGLTLASSLTAGVMTFTLSIALQIVLPYFSASHVIGRMAKYGALAALYGYAAAIVSTELELHGVVSLLFTITAVFSAYFITLILIKDRILIRIYRSVNRELLGRG